MKHQNLRVDGNFSGCLRLGSKRLCYSIDSTGFDFSAAVILAGYSFESYNYPVYFDPKQNSFLMSMLFKQSIGKSVHSLDGTNIKYTSSTFIKSLYQGYSYFLSLEMTSPLWQGW